MLIIILCIIFIGLICYLRYKAKQKLLKRRKIVPEVKSYSEQSEQEKTRRRKQIAKGIIK